MLKRWILSFILLQCITTSTAQAQSAPPLTVEDAVSVALKNNPRLSGAARDVLAAELGVSSARTLANPEITFAPGITSIFGSEQELLISQPLEINGTRTARAGVATAQARATKAQALTVLRDLVFDTKTAYYELARAEEHLSLAQELLKAAEEFDRIARRQVELGKRPGIETTQTGIELSRARQQVTLAESQVTIARAALNTQMGKSPSEPIGTLSFPLLSSDLPDREAALAQALSTRSEIATEEATGDAFKQEARLARAQGLPDLAPQFRAGSVTRGFKEYGLGLAISIPLFDYGSRRDRIRQAEASALAQGDRATAARNQVEKEVEQALVRLLAAQSVLKGYSSELLAQSERLLKASRTGFEEGQTSIISLLEAQRTYRTVQNEYVNAQADYALALAELEHATGRVPPSLLITPQPKTRKPK